MENVQFVIKRREDEDFLSHHGVKGQKWGIRRYQNEDGSLTPEGEKYYAKIKKWQNSATGQRETSAAKSRGVTQEAAYRAHKSAKAGAVGWLVGGIAGAAIGSIVSSKRSEQGREFISNVLAGKYDKQVPSGGT